MKLANSLSQEEQRYIREEFQNDEQLAIYDLLFMDNLLPEDIKKIKKISKDLLKKIKEKINSIDHCFDKEEGQASIKVVIRDMLYQDLPDSVYGHFETYQRKIYDYIYTKYGCSVA